MSESLVDLLLVRLGREEEKRKVLKLLITNLDLSVTEAELAVANSPSVIKEAVPMSEARIVQKDLYPYIDLLPRLDDEGGGDEVENKSSTSESVEELPIDEDAEIEEIEDFSEDTSHIDDEPLEQEISPGKSTKHPVVEDFPEDYQSFEEEEIVEEEKEEEDDDAILITSATDEILSSARCHICGRSPSRGEKLAPCRTCGDFTCRNCFDREAHVCKKCASEGKTVGKAQSSYYKTEEDLEFDNEEVEEISESKGLKALRIIGLILFLAAVGYAFYYFDPLELFQVTSQESEILTTESVAHDSLLVEDDTTIVDSSDSLEIAEVYPDSLDISPDSLVILTVDSIDLDDPYQIFSLRLPEKFEVVENSSFAFRTRTPSYVRADILLDESEVLFEHIGNIASAIPIEIDDAALLLYEDSITLVVFSILHFENMDRRIGFAREVSTFLKDSNIDQIVVIFQENQYFEPVHYGIPKDSFAELEGIFNPTQFQNLLGYYDGCQEFVVGPVLEWLSISD